MFMGFDVILISPWCDHRLGRLGRLGRPCPMRVRRGTILMYFPNIIPLTHASGTEEVVQAREGTPY